MAIQVPDIRGDELTPAILKKYPALKILVLTNFGSAHYVK
jgi:two-component system secretion response regulator SsrB